MLTPGKVATVVVTAANRDQNKQTSHVTQGQLNESAYYALKCLTGC